MTRRLLPWVITISLCLIGVAGNRVLLWMTAPLIPETSSSQPPPLQVIEIPEGATFKQVVGLLDEHRLIASRLGFLLLGKLMLAERRILPGEYALHAGMRPREILSTLVEGRIVLHPVTIPEGFTVAQIADLLAVKGLADPSEFLELTRDREFIRTLQLEVPTLEGYLFPNTYHFARHTPAKEIIKTMVEELWRAFTPELRARAKDINMTVHEVLTLASLIEKETGVEEERELVASVFHNRLRRRIPLQSDPTVIYGLEAFDGNLRKRDLLKYSAYNTYQFPGLPPGPIANPGLRSIRAALYPISTNYLYFVSRNDGTHHFSSTLTEHNRAVEKYQRRQARRLS